MHVKCPLNIMVILNTPPFSLSPLTLSSSPPLLSSFFLFCLPSPLLPLFPIIAILLPGSHLPSSIHHTHSEGMEPKDITGTLWYVILRFVRVRYMLTHSYITSKKCIETDVNATESILMQILYCCMLLLLFPCKSCCYAQIMPAP